VRKRSKLGNVRTVSLDRRPYHSKSEAAYADQLFLTQRADTIKGYQPQVRIDLVGIDGQPLIIPRTGKPLRHYVDFRVTELDGSYQLRIDKRL
jgi:hypothetical protein